MFLFNFLNHAFPKSSPRMLNISILAILGIMLGIAPQISLKSYSLNFDSSAYAQNYTRQEMTNYARAGWQIELLRRRTYKKIKQETNSRPPNIVCNRPETIDRLPQNIRGIARNYCHETTNIIRNNNLSIRRFNQLKKEYDNGGQFHRQVQQILIDFQHQKSMHVIDK